VVATGMKIAVPSGKGGAGKTTVATNLAYVAARTGLATAYLDCDVEEPNGHLFLKPELEQSSPVTTLVPRVDADACSHCGLCGEICHYSAIVCIGDRVLTYPELCHACGGCALVCPEQAISEVPRPIGHLETGHAGSIQLVQGRLDIGEPMSPPIIKAVKAAAPEADVVIIDAPPGASCPVVESIRDCDLVALVAESTPFGLNDLQIAVEMVRFLGLPFGVIINRFDLGDGGVRRYCQRERISILGEIPDDRRVAEAYSRGELISQALPEYGPIFANLLQAIMTVGTTTAAGVPGDA
jgi:MinD superfamily P-loop ATPase